MLRRQADPEPFRLGDLAIRHEQREVTVAGRARGTGLGLVILVEAHGGRIEVESGGEGEGTRVTFTTQERVPGGLHEGSAAVLESSQDLHWAERDPVLPHRRRAGQITCAASSESVAVRPVAVGRGSRGWLRRWALLAMIKRRATTGGAAAFDVLPHVPRGCRSDAVDAVNTPIDNIPVVGPVRREYPPSRPWRTGLGGSRPPARFSLRVRLTRSPSGPARKGAPHHVQP